MGTIYQRTVLQFKDVCVSSHNMLLTCCPHFSALTAPRFSVDKSKGTGSVMSFDDEGRGGGVKLGNGCAWKFSCACHQQKIYLIQPSCCASINFKQHPTTSCPARQKLCANAPPIFHPPFPSPPLAFELLKIGLIKFLPCKANIVIKFPTNFFQILKHLLANLTVYLTHPYL